MNLNVLKNIVDGFANLRSDFTGITLNAGGILHAIFGVIVTVFLMLTIYFVGRRARMFFVKNHEYDFFIDISFGYIIIGSLVGILGILSSLKLIYILLLFSFLVLFSFTKTGVINLIKQSSHIWSKFKNGYKKEKLIYFGITAFVLIAFLRLFTPEIREDAVGYHTTFPSMYVKAHTTLIKSNDSFRILPAPQLGEMLYVVTDSLRLKEFSRFINFYFYILLTVLILKSAKEKIGQHSGYVALFFVTTPVIIGLTSSAYTDFQSLFCWLLAVLLLTSKKITETELFLASIIFGGVLATKLWTLAFIAPLIFYVLLRSKDRHIKNTTIFVISSFLVPSIWYIRAFLLAKNPLFPAFSHARFIDGSATESSIGHFIGINTAFLNVNSIYPFSPLFFLAILFSIINFRKILPILNKNHLFMLFILVWSEFLIVNYPYGRFLLILYVLFIFFASYGMSLVVKNVIGKILVLLILFTMSLYYFTTTILTLPYGLGWANTNAYLTRVLARDNSSYYDFDHKFDKFLTSNDLVATYQVNGFYYANFPHIDVFNVITFGNRDFSAFYEKKITKLFINGGDIIWFCKKLKVSNCTQEKYRLLSYYAPAPRYLYEIRK